MEILLYIALPLLAVLGFDLFNGGDDAADSTKGAGNGDDSIRGSDLADQLNGFGGEDTVRGLGGDDTLRGGLGPDLLDGGAGNDLLRGGAGEDALLGQAGNDTLYGDSDADLLLGDAGNDLIYMGSGDDLGFVLPPDFADGYRFGQLGDDTIYGEAGNDDVFDYAGRNIIYGGAGNDGLSSFDVESVGGDIRQSDAVYGGAGNDELFGDYGDTLSGGAGNDTLNAFAQVADNSATIIEGYNAAEDKLQINVDPSLANATAWRLAATTDSQTGDVSVFLQNVATPTTVIDLALLKSPTNFQVSQIALTFETTNASA